VKASFTALTAGKEAFTALTAGKEAFTAFRVTYRG